MYTQKEKKWLSSLHKGSDFSISKKPKPRKPKINAIDMDHNDHGHLFSLVEYRKMSCSPMLVRVWKCSSCGLTGLQTRFAPIIELAKGYIDVSCPKDNSMMKNLMQPRGWVRLYRDMPQFGFKADLCYKVVPCPPEQMLKFGDDVWIFSDERKEPVRLLMREFCFIKNE